MQTLRINLCLIVLLLIVSACGGPTHPAANYPQWQIGDWWMVEVQVPEGQRAAHGWIQGRQYRFTVQRTQGSDADRAFVVEVTEDPATFQTPYARLLYRISDLQILWDQSSFYLNGEKQIPLL